MYTRVSQLQKDLRTRDDAFWLNLGQKQALKVFHKSAEHTPAYGDFLAKNGIKNHTKIRSFKDFIQHVPITDKENYIKKYPISELCYGGNQAVGSIISQSSGTISGKSSLWPRFRSSEERSGLLHEALLHEFFKHSKLKTLYVICFHLGSHIAGFVTATSIRDVVYKTSRGTLMTPGLDKKDILTILKKVSPHYEQTVLIGYPPFLKDVMREAIGEKIKVNKLNIKYIFSAESFPEHWREYVHELAGHKKGVDNVSINIYGSADVGFMAHETPAMVRLRRLLAEDEKTCEELRITQSYIPALYQFHPWAIYFESINSELVCSADAGIPLIRYNIKDFGQVYSFSPDEKIKQKIFRAGDWKLPIISVYGRSNYSATIYGVNIYPEHIRQIMTTDDFFSMCSGKFFLKTTFGKEDENLEIHMELNPKARFESGTKRKLQKNMVAHLQKINLEYQKLCSVVQRKAYPKLITYKFGSPEFRALKMKFKYIVTN
jgi:phenylacetate-CoA ligase